MTDHRLHRGARAAGENPFQHVGLPTVDGETIGPADLDDAGREPALVAGRQPLRRVVAALLATVHVRAGEGEVAKVPGEPCPGCAVPGAQPRVMGLARRHHVFDVRLGRARKASASVGAIDRPRPDGARSPARPTAGSGSRASGRRESSDPRAPRSGRATSRPLPECASTATAERIDAAAGGHDAGHGGSASPAKSARRLSAMRAADAFTESRARCA